MGSLVGRHSPLRALGGNAQGEWDLYLVKAFGWYCSGSFPVSGAVKVSAGTVLDTFLFDV